MTDRQYNGIIVNYEVFYMSDIKSANALFATDKMEKIILEKFLADDIPGSKKFNLKQVCKYTGCKYYNLRNYIHSDLYTISKDSIEITDDIQLISHRSKEYVERLIKKMVRPAKYENNKYVYSIAKLFDNSYFTEEEQTFIKLMTNELFLIIKQNNTLRRIDYKDLVGFYQLNRRPFLYTARQVFNDILHKKICVGDNISEYIKTYLTDFQVAEILKNSCKYDYFFDGNGILKCDLDTNKNILIKNFLSSILHDLTDDKAKTILLLKLNGKYPFLISEKIFYEFD